MVMLSGASPKHWGALQKHLILDAPALAPPLLGAWSQVWRVPLPGKGTGVANALCPVLLFRYRPVLPVEYIERALGFADREDVLAFLAELNVTLAEDGASVDCKESLAAVLAA